MTTPTYTPTNPVITRTLELSTGNVCKDTRDWLQDRVDTKDNGLQPVIIYEKGQYGYFVGVPDEIDPDAVESGKLPADLYGLLTYAKALGCSRIELDMDAQGPAWLPTFEW